MGAPTPASGESSNMSLLRSADGRRARPRDARAQAALGKAVVNTTREVDGPKCDVTKVVQRKVFDALGAVAITCHRMETFGSGADPK